MLRFNNFFNAGFFPSFVVQFYTFLYVKTKVMLYGSVSTAESLCSKNFVFGRFLDELIDSCFDLNK